MSRATLEWLAALIQAQSIHLGDPNARAAVESAFRALDEIGQALAALDPA